MHAGYTARRTKAPAACEVLIVEDDNISRRVLHTILAQLGFGHIDMEDNGEAAVSAAAAKRYDLIFMDLRLPVLDGLSAARRIMADCEGQRPVMIAVTTNTLPEIKQQCMAAGMADYIIKPYYKATLVEVLDHYFPVVL
ncbi:response regulator [Paenibacillus mucilaginosus]|uniref:Histidine kinase n=2 Tax=Paenibacillus mucilaginosus TaxID=61624 RepID=I0BAU5_9BACL|nr:response regulator [Paenibacillus mucilaginosus]AEI39051.1 probable sensor/response regulator hybrid [Paenibacillus mucilaginosus KNP414]AFH59492.2 histidine kinase [Paenibacillus mucilaginosus K02]MCG7216183.1 response regulator [Paenibacillus mucilaginosus]WDM28088.1 response regulator [Paenibacillus mucilaginosus]